MLKLLKTFNFGGLLGTSQDPESKTLFKVYRDNNDRVCAVPALTGLSEEQLADTPLGVAKTLDEDAIDDLLKRTSDISELSRPHYLFAATKKEALQLGKNSTISIRASSFARSL